jgi:hypothetical protein
MLATIAGQAICPCPRCFMQLVTAARIGTQLPLFVEVAK